MSKIITHGHEDATTHTIDLDEQVSFVSHINAALGTNIEHSQLYASCNDGLLLARLINSSVSATIDERVLNVKPAAGAASLNPFQKAENANLVINSAKAIGCSVVNIGCTDVIEGVPHLVLGLVWQIIRVGLNAQISIKHHPELFRLLKEDETIDRFLKLGAEQILLRWVNHHLAVADNPSAKQIKNFGNDIKDGNVYTVLLNQLKPVECSLAPLHTTDLMNRAEQILVNSDKIGCRKYLTPKTLVAGNLKLNFAYIANLFNTHPGLEPPTDQLQEWIESAGEREARAFALWLNSLGCEPFVNSLFDDLQDGLVLLYAISRIHPDIPDFKKVNKAPCVSKFKKVENCNYVVLLCKLMKFSLVGIQGSDITDGNVKLTLALVWQLMRENIVCVLKSAGGGRDITDSDIIEWANTAVKNGGGTSKMSGFKDSGLANSVFFLELLQDIKKGSVDPSMIKYGTSEDDLKMNARYAISIARKLGAVIFLLPEDIMECNPKMVMTFVGSLMAIAKNK